MVPSTVPEYMFLKGKEGGRKKGEKKDGLRRWQQATIFLSSLCFPRVELQSKIRAIDQNHSLLSLHILRTS